ncbi:hypothetical protein V6N12_046354 [Hibiscus sabdariffa]|uniref:Uncharacterized protein n=1 Tax=Hibiscus sabdariffa TaxID=183260 RepID=A0ABR2DIF7_9ROSI
MPTSEAVVSESLTVDDESSALGEDVFPASTQSPQSSSAPSPHVYSQPLHVISDGNAIDISSLVSSSADNGISASGSSHTDSPVAFSPTNQETDFATPSHGSEAEQGLVHRVAMDLVHHKSSSPPILTAREAVPEGISTASTPPENVATTEVSYSQHEVHREEPTEAPGGNSHHMVTRSKAGIHKPKVYHVQIDEAHVDVYTALQSPQ